ncbi:MAG: HAD family phosphatase [Firmicutes bacterium]|nr:HAD family phosphatase [Bacillota bacterium]
MKAILFDFDGTLIDSMSVWFDIDCELLRRNGYEPDEEYISKISTVTFEQGIRYILGRYDLKKTAKELLAEIEEMARVQYTEKVPLKAGAKEILAAAREKGFKTALVTSCRKPLCIGLLKNRGIEDMFDKLIFTEDYDMNKNEPYIYEKAAEALGVSAAEAYIFEDSPHAAEGAKKSGGHVVGVYDAYFDKYKEKMKDICDDYIMSLTDYINKL